MSDEPPKKPQPQGGPAAPGFASPPCRMHETDPAYAGMLPQGELLALLNALLEAERAGVKVTGGYAATAKSALARTVLRETGIDEARFCAMLARQIARLGGEASHATGDFAQAALAVEGDAPRLAFLNRGQGWVARKLREALPKIADDALHADLAEMLDVHERNIARCNRLTGGG